MTRRGATRCRGCGAQLRFVVMPSGRRMPVDPEPHELGNVLLTGPGEGRVVAGRETLARLQADPEVRLYVSHFATCPARQKRRRAQPIEGNR